MTRRCLIREVTSRLMLRNGVEWGLKGGEFVKNAFHFCLEFSVRKHFLRTYPGGQLSVPPSNGEPCQYQNVWESTSEFHSEDFFPCLVFCHVTRKVSSCHLGCGCHVGTSSTRVPLDHAAAATFLLSTPHSKHPLRGTTFLQALPK